MAQLSAVIFGWPKMGFRRVAGLSLAAAVAFAPALEADEAADLGAEIVAMIAHADPAGAFTYDLTAEIEGCVLTIVETETEASRPDTPLRTTTITIDFARLDADALASEGGFLSLRMLDDAKIGYEDSYSYGRIDRLDAREKTLDIAADADRTGDLLAAMADLAALCQGATPPAGNGTETSDGGFWGPDTVGSAPTPIPTPIPVPTSVPVPTPIGQTGSTELDDWQVARRLDTVASYLAYLAAHPEGDFILLAEHRIGELKALASPVPSEADLWRDAVLSDEPAAYLAYLKAYPDGPNADAARDRLRMLGVATIETIPNRNVTPGENPPPPVQPTPTPAPDPAELAEAAEQALGLNRRAVREIQRRLKLIGHNPGGVDGLIGPRTRSAIRSWQTKRGFLAHGYLDSQQIALLEQESQQAYRQWQAEQRERAERERRRREQARREREQRRATPVPPRETRPPRVSSQGCARDSRGRIIGGVSARCDAAGAQEALYGR